MPLNIAKILRTKLPDFLSEPATRQSRLQVVKHVIQVNTQKGGPFQLIEDKLIELLKAQHVTATVITAALNRIEEIDAVDSLFNILKNIILAEAAQFEASGEKLYAGNDNELTAWLMEDDTLQDELTQWVHDEYAPVDERIELTRQRKVRRFDSLARILSSQRSSISVCNAVTIDTSSLSPRLIMSANLSKSGDDSSYLQELGTKLKILKSFYTHYSSGDKKLPDESQCEALSLELYQALYPRHSALSPVDNEPNILMQSVYKLTHALLYDRATLTDAEKQSFLNESPAVVLLPAVVDNSVHMQLNYLTPRGKIQAHTPLKHRIHPGELKYIHAEQMIAIYLYEQYKAPQNSQFIFGIAKLCCATCSEFLENYPGVAFRGHHQKQYQGVINLDNGMRSAQTSAHSGPTAPKKSPFKSPVKSSVTHEDVDSPIAQEGGMERPQYQLALDKFGTFSKKLNFGSHEVEKKHPAAAASSAHR